MTGDQSKQAQQAVVLAAHRERLRILADERRQILQRQADVLRGYVKAGVQLPSAVAAATPASSGTSSAAARATQRQFLVEQLVAEEAAAQAALEALKQVLTTCCMTCGAGWSNYASPATSASSHIHATISTRDQGATLTRSREIGGKVLRHQKELAQHDRGLGSEDDGPHAADANQAPHHPAAGAAVGGDAVRSVFLIETLDGSGGAGDGDGDGAGDEAGTEGGGNEGLHSPHSRAAFRTAAAAGGRPPRPATAKATAAAPPSASAAPKQRARTAAAPDASPHATPQPASQVEELRQQMAALQAALDGRGWASTNAPSPPPPLMPPYGYYPMQAWGSAPPFPYMIAQPTPLQLAPPPPPQPQQHHQQQQQQSPTQQPSPELLKGDPELAAAHVRHMRHMTLMRMEVDQARTAEELERILASLAELRGQQQQQQQQQRGGRVTVGRGGDTSANEEGDNLWDSSGAAAADVLQAQQQREGAGEMTAAGQAGQQQQEHAPGSPQPATMPAAEDAEAWQQHADPTAQHDAAAAALDAERLSGGEGSALQAARGAAADTDVLRVTLQSAGPLNKRGTCRCAVRLGVR